MRLVSNEWDAFIASIERPATQKRIKTLMARSFHRASDVENRLGYDVGQFGNRQALSRQSQA